MQNESKTEILRHSSENYRENVRGQTIVKYNVCCPQRTIRVNQSEQEEDKLDVKLPEVEVQSFAVTLRYMYTDCIFPLVKGKSKGACH